MLGEFNLNPCHPCETRILHENQIEPHKVYFKTDI